MRFIDKLDNRLLIMSFCSTQTFNAQVLKKYEEKHSKPVEVNKAELERKKAEKCKKHLQI